MADDEPRDVRDTLSELERRLLDLERELRADAAQDTVSSAPGAPIASGAPSPQTPIAAPAAATASTAAPVAPAPGVEALAGDARARVDALRDSLDGLVGASDRLRETAQTVVEDHGRALVRLDRAGAAQTAAAPPEPAQQAAPPTELPPVPEPAPAAGAGEPPEPEGGIGRRGMLLLAGGGLLVAGLIAGIVGALALSGGKTTTTTARSPAAQPFLVMRGTPDLGVPAPRRVASVQAALAAVCAGRARAALVVTADGFPAPCFDLVPVAHETLSARALAIPIPSGGRGRRCVSLGAVDALARSRADAALTARRGASVAAAQRVAVAGARVDALPPAGVVRAGRTAQATAGAAFDSGHRLRLLGVSAQPGATCVSPVQPALQSGGYPLSSRLTLVATSATAGTAAVIAVRDAMTAALGGAVPVAVTVLR